MPPPAMVKTIVAGLRREVKFSKATCHEEEGVFLPEVLEERGDHILSHQEEEL